MDPDLAITIAFGLEVVLFALVGAIYGVHEARRERQSLGDQRAPVGARDRSR